MNEELINQIVRRILSDPSLQGLLQGRGNSEGNNGLKPEALVLLNYVPDFPRLFKALSQRWGAGYTLKLLPSDQVFSAKPELPEGMSWLSAEEAMAKNDWAKIILPACSANTLAKAALGIRDNPICEMIGRGITRGCSLELVTEYLGFTDQTPPAYWELYEGYLQKLQAYGVTVWAALGEGRPSADSARQARPGQSDQTNQSGQLGRPATTAAEPEGNSAPEEIPYTKKFLGDKQACGFPEGARVLVGAGTVISPLARDTLKLRCIKLCLEKEAGQ